MNRKKDCSNSLAKKFILLTVLFLTSAVHTPSTHAQAIPQWAKSELNTVKEHWIAGITKEEAKAAITDIIIRLATGWQPPTDGLVCSPYTEPAVHIQKKNVGDILNGKMVAFDENNHLYYGMYVTTPEVNITHMQTGETTKHNLWPVGPEEIWQIDHINTDENVVVYRFQEKTVWRDFDCNRAGDCSYEILRTQPAKIARIDASGAEVEYRVVTLPEGIQYFSNMVWDKKRNLIHGIAYGHKQPYRVVSLNADTLDVVQEQVLPARDHYDISEMRGYSAQNLYPHSLVLTMLPDNNRLLMTGQQEKEVRFSAIRSFEKHIVVVLDASTLTIGNTYESLEYSNPLATIPKALQTEYWRTKTGRKRRIDSEIPRPPTPEYIQYFYNISERETQYDEQNNVVVLRYGQAEFKNNYQKKRDDMIVMQEGDLHILHRLSEDMSGELAVLYIDIKEGKAYVQKDDNNIYVYEYMTGVSTLSSDFAMHTAMVRGVPHVSAYVQTDVQKHQYNSTLDTYLYKQVNMCEQ